MARDIAGRVQAPHPPGRRSIMNIDIKNNNYYYYLYLRNVPQVLLSFSMCSSSLSLITFSCVSILKLQWLSSPHALTQHGGSHDALQRDKKLNGFKADSGNHIFIYIYIIT